MKLLSKVFFILFVININLIFAQQTQESAPKIAIMDLTLLGEINPEYASIVRENLTTSLVKTKKYRVVERALLNKIFQEMRLIDSDDFTDEEVLEIGKLAKAKYIAVGSLANAAGSIILNIRVIEIETAEIVYAENERFNSIYESDYVTDKIANLIAGLKPKREAKFENRNRIKLSRDNIIGIALSSVSGALILGSIPLFVLSGINYDSMYNKYLDEYGLSNREDAQTFAEESPEFYGPLAGGLVCSILGVIGLVIFIPMATQKPKNVFAFNAGYRYGLCQDGVAVGMSYTF